MRLYYIFLVANFNSRLKNKCEFSFCLFLAKQPFFTRTYCTLTYRRLIGFMTSFAYLGFLDTRLSLGPSLFSIPSVPRYRVTSMSKFYQT